MNDPIIAQAGPNLSLAERIEQQLEDFLREQNIPVIGKNAVQQLPNQGLPVITPRPAPPDPTALIRTARLLAASTALLRSIEAPPPPPPPPPGQTIAAAAAALRSSAVADARAYLEQRAAARRRELDASADRNPLDLPTTPTDTAARVFIARVRELSPQTTRDVLAMRVEEAQAKLKPLDDAQLYDDGARLLRLIREAVTPDLNRTLREAVSQYEREVIAADAVRRLGIPQRFDLDPTPADVSAGVGAVILEFGLRLGYGTLTAAERAALEALKPAPLRPPGQDPDARDPERLPGAFPDRFFERNPADP